MGQKSSKQSVVWTHWRCCREHGDWTVSEQGLSTCLLPKLFKTAFFGSTTSTDIKPLYSARLSTQHLGQYAVPVVIGSAISVARSEPVQEKKILEYPDHDPDDPLHSPTGQGKEREDRKLEK
ncbi:uncharacterized protein PAC_12580 [Phialocephala subalpina]|uniref:Uncharacterized protein n=1 Tax=Phialocephala subalpina TaxID=576137 RepID=A0A1L7XCE3_9HELO|nr:uncharacterized protein PAC_12580 [Phialocephala subalpina]